MPAAESIELKEIVIWAIGIGGGLLGMLMATMAKLIIDLLRSQLGKLDEISKAFHLFRGETAQRCASHGSRIDRLESDVRGMRQ